MKIQIIYNTESSISLQNENLIKTNLDLTVLFAVVLNQHQLDTTN